MKLMEVPHEAVPDLPDRVIAATGLLHGMPILRRDRRNSGIGAPNDLVAGRLPVVHLGVVNWWRFWSRFEQKRG